MPIIDSREDNLDIQGDVNRHHDKVKKAIKDKLPDILSSEDIITSDTKGRKIRVPVKSLHVPDLRPGNRSKGSGDGEGDGDGEGGGKVGVGQGPGKQGDVIGRRPVNGQGNGEGGGKAGNEAGEDMIESEFTIEEIIEMMFEDLGLPNLMKKDLATIEVSLGFKISGTERIGPMVLLKKRPTAKQGIKTFWGLLSYLCDKFKNKSEVDCYAVLKKSGGDIAEAEKLLEDVNFTHNETQVNPFPIIGNNDLRFFNIEEKKTSETNAVVFAILDVSGSMGNMKKYIARAILFWTIKILRLKYTNVEIRFIVHHTEARFVQEKNFLSTSESGGTNGKSAFRLANAMIEDKYPTSSWNVYTFYFSDGDDFEPRGAIDEMKKMLDMGINLLGFANIKDNEHEIFSLMPSWSGDLMKMIKDEWPVCAKKISTPMGDIEIVSGNSQFPFVSAVICDKEHVSVALRELLNPNGGK
jgi:hypothetical protein